MAEAFNYSILDSADLMRCLGINPNPPQFAAIGNPRGGPGAAEFLEEHFGIRRNRDQTHQNSQSSLSRTPNQNSFGLMTSTTTTTQYQPLDLRSTGPIGSNIGPSFGANVGGGATPSAPPAQPTLFEQFRVQQHNEFQIPVDELFASAAQAEEIRRQARVRLSSPVPDAASTTSTSPSKQPTISSQDKEENDQALKWAQDYILKLERDIQVLKEARTCKVCMDLEVSHVFIPCGHAIICKKCVGEVKKCPICRANIQGSLVAYFA